MKLLLLSLLCVFYYGKLSSAEIICNAKGEEELDKVVKELYLFGAVDRPYPRDQSEMTKFCKTNSELAKYVKDYSEKCLPKQKKMVINLLVYSVVKTTNNMCKSRRRTQEFIRLSQCGNSAKNGTSKCWKTLIGSLNGIKSYKDAKLKIPLVCCNYFPFKHCATKEYEDVKCNSKQIDALEGLLNSYALEVLNLLCGDYTEDSDKCDQIVHLTPKFKSKTLPQSPVSAFIDILDSLPQ